MRSNLSRKKRPKLERTAYHEAGHAVMFYLLGGTSKELSIVPDDAQGSLGHHQTGPWIGEDSHVDVALRLEDIEALEKRILVLLAGNMAEKVLWGRYNNIGAGSDYASAIGLALDLAGKNRDANACLRWLNTKARLILWANWHLVEAVAYALLEKRRLDTEEIVQCIELSQSEWEAAGLRAESLGNKE